MSSSLFLVEEDVHRLINSAGDQARGVGGNPCYSYNHAASAAASRHRHGNVLKELKYIPELQQFIALEQRSVAITLYNADDFSVAAVMRPCSNRGVPDAVAYLPGRDVMISCSGDLRMKWWEMGDSRTEVQARSWNLENSQACLQWIPEHQRLYSGSMLGTVHTWDIDRGAECAKMMHGHGPSHTSSTATGTMMGTSGLTPPVGKGDVVTTLAYLPHLDKLVSAGLDSRICIWDIDINERTALLGRSFEKNASPKGHTRGVLSLAYLEEQKLLVSAGFDHDAYVWSPFGNTVLFTLEGHRTSLTSVERLGGATSPYVLSGDEDGIFKVWDIRKATGCLETFSSGEQGVRGVVSLACCEQSHHHHATVEEEDEAPFGTTPLRHQTSRRRRSARSGSDGSSSSSTKVAERGAHEGQVTGDDNVTGPIEPPLLPHILVSTSSGAVGQIHVFSPAVRESALPNSGVAHNDSVLGCAFDPTFDRVLTAAGRTVKVWSITTGALIKAFRDITDSTITALVSCISQRVFFVGDDRGGISMFNVYSGALLKRLLSHRLEVSKLIVATDALFSLSWDGSIVIHNIANVQSGLVKSRPFIADPTHAHVEDLTCASILLNAEPGTYSSNSSPTPCFWPIRGSGDDDVPVRSASQELLATGSVDGTVRLWELETGKLAMHLKRPPGSLISCVCFLTPLPLIVAADNFGAEVWGLPRTSSGKYLSVARFSLTEFGPPVLNEDDPDDDDDDGGDHGGAEKKERGVEKRPSHAPAWAQKLAVPVIVAAAWDGNTQRLLIADDYGQIFCFTLEQLKNFSSRRSVTVSSKMAPDCAAKPTLLWRRRLAAKSIQILRVCRARSHRNNAALITTYVDGSVGLVDLDSGMSRGWLVDSSALVDRTWNFPCKQDGTDDRAGEKEAESHEGRRSARREKAHEEEEQRRRRHGGASKSDSDEDVDSKEWRFIEDHSGGDDRDDLQPAATAMQWWRAKSRESSSRNIVSVPDRNTTTGKNANVTDSETWFAGSSSAGNSRRKNISTRGLLVMPKGKQHTMTKNKQCRSAAEKLLASFEEWNALDSR